MGNNQAQLLKEFCIDLITYALNAFRPYTLWLAARSTSLGHNFLGFGPNWMQLVSLESLRSLVSNSKIFHWI